MPAPVVQLHLEVRRRLGRLLPPARPLAVLVGVSGGPDSVALLDVMARVSGPLDLELAVLHVNYALRGEASLEDERFVAHLSRSYQVPFHLRALTGDETASLRSGDLQARARRIRLAAFEELRSDSGYRLLVLGHQRSDQAETVLMNLLRGTGPDGLKGMVELSAAGVLRPLLPYGRAQILEYLGRRALPCRHDASNREDRYLRNRIRHQALPWLETFAGHDLEPILDRLARVQAAESELMELLARKEYGQICRTEGSSPILGLARLRRLPVALKRRIARRFLAACGAGARTGLEAIDGFLHAVLDGPSGSKVPLGPGRTGQKIGEELVGLPAGDEPPAPGSWILPVPGELEVSGHGLRIRAEIRDPGELAGAPESGVLLMDADRIPGPLEVRTRRPDDRIDPPGMQGRHKTVARLLRDRKVPPHRRAEVLVVVAGDRIVGVLGHVPGESVRVGPASRRILRLELRPMSRS